MIKSPERGKGIDQQPSKGSITHIPEGDDRSTGSLCCMSIFSENPFPWPECGSSWLSLQQPGGRPEGPHKLKPIGCMQNPVSTGIKKPTKDRLLVYEKNLPYTMETSLGSLLVYIEFDHSMKHWKVFSSVSLD